MEPLLAAESSVEEILVVEVVRESEGVVEDIVENVAAMGVKRRREWADGGKAGIYWWDCISLMRTKHYATRFVVYVTWARAWRSSRLLGSPVPRPRTSKVFLCSLFSMELKISYYR